MMTQPIDPTIQRTTSVIDQVKTAVLNHFAALNSGDTQAHAEHYLPDATGFSTLGGLLVSGGLDSQHLSTKRVVGRKYDLECRDLQVSLYGDVALITFYVYGSIAPSEDGKRKTISGRSTSIRARHEGQWKIAHTHGSALNDQDGPDS